MNNSPPTIPVYSSDYSIGHGEMKACRGTCGPVGKHGTFMYLAVIGMIFKRNSVNSEASLRLVTSLKRV